MNGFCSLHDQTTGRIIDDVLYFLSQERLLELVMNSHYITRDKLLLFFILTKLETKDLNTYFSSLKDISNFKSYFMRLPDMILKTMISRNYQLFQYIMMLMMDGDSEGAMYADFFNKYPGEMGRISFLVKTIKDLPNPDKAIQYFNSESVFIDEFEKKIIHAIVTNPVLKNVFHDYDRLNDGKQGMETQN